MTDPFRVLSEPVEPARPDPAFTRRLRARVARELALPNGVVPLSEAEQPRPAAVPYLAVSDARAAIDWYTEIFGARLTEDPVVMPDGRVGHSELQISDGMIYLSDAHPEIGVTAPRPGESSVSLMLPVDDADATRARALDAGASGDRPPYDGHGTRNAWIVDPFGHRWGLHSPLLAPPAREASLRHGDVGYVSLWVPAAQAASQFYATVLAWEVGADGHVVRDRHPDVGITQTTTTLDLFCCYAVDDLTAALERVDAAAGTSGERVDEPWGPTALCADDQGVRFALYETGGESGPRPAQAPGDVIYLTLEVVDSARARAFYGSVLGWEFESGRIEDGWQVLDAFPMIGMSGGHDRATAVPMWTVTDVAAAVDAVRARGGTATDPERQPYGLSSECTDDQGMRFYLGEA